MNRWFFLVADALLRNISSNGARSYSVAGIRFLTAADVKVIFPESVIGEGKSETYSIRSLEVERTAFFLEGASDPRHAERFTRGYILRIEAPFSARFEASVDRKLFAASGCLLIRDSKRGAFFVSPESQSSRRLNSAFRFPKSERVKSFFSISSCKSFGFADFGLLMLPKLARIANVNRNGFLNLPRYLPYISQYLDLMQFEAVRPQRKSKNLLPVDNFAEVVFGPGIEDGFVCLRSDMDLLRERVIPQLTETPYKKVYLSREGRRKIRNENEFRPFLDELGIQFIEDKHVNVLDQAALFHGADFIVAPHGALLTNLMFCRPGTVLVELLPGSYHPACYRNLCQIVGIHYYAVVCTKLTAYLDAAVSEDFCADTKRLFEFVKMILVRCSESQ